MANAMTYIEAVNAGIKALGEGNPEAVEKLNALVVQLGKRGTKGGMTKTQKENVILREAILGALTDAGRFISPAEIKEYEGLEELSVPKIGALMKQLIAEGKAQKHMHKKHVLYAVAGVEFVAPEAEAEAE